MALADAGMRAISYDRRGFGRSGQPWSGYDYDTLADDLADVIDATGARDATLVGFSMSGGEVARYMSRHDGKNVAQAVLVSAVVPRLLKTADNPHGVLWRGIRYEARQPGATALGARRSDDGQPESDAGVCRGVCDDRLQGRHGCLPRTLVIHGTSDTAVPIDATGHVAARIIRKAQFIESDGAPHGLFATHKGQLTGDLLAFLRG